MVPDGALHSAFHLLKPIQLLCFASTPGQAACCFVLVALFAWLVVLVFVSSGGVLVQTSHVFVVMLYVDSILPGFVELHF